MSVVNGCPECGKSFNTNVKRCSCGWLKPANQTSTIADHRCWYNIQKKRCPLPGTISKSLYGKAAWYCRRHHKTLSDPILGEAELNYIEKNYQKIISEEYKRKK